MNHKQEPTPSFVDNKSIEQIAALVHSINEILARYPDRDWNYSRIRLRLAEPTALESPYFLGCEVLDDSTAHGRAERKTVQDEVAWGEHHESELGILEIISRRLNKALLALPGHCFAADPVLKGRRPVIRLVRREELQKAQVPVVLWYEVQEVNGEEFENR